MIPCMLKIVSQNSRGKKFKILFPLFIVWFLLFFFILIFAPLLLFISLLAWPFGYGKMILMFPVMLYEIILSLKDLLIDVKNKNEIIYISFY